MEIRERIEEIRAEKESEFLYIEVVEPLRSFTNKILSLNSHRLPLTGVKVHKVEVGNEKYYDKVLKGKLITRLKLPNPEYEIQFPDIFKENNLILKYGYRLPSLNHIDEIIESFHSRKRIIISKWFLTIEPTPNLKTIFVLYPVEFIYPINFWEKELNEEFWKKAYQKTEVVRFSNI